MFLFFFVFLFIVPAGWCEIPLYVVGQATASALINVFGAYAHLGLTRVNVRGQSSGNVATLASFILEDPDKPSMLLYLTGDKNRDILTHILQGGGISLNPFQPYRTEGSPSFAEKLSAAIQTSSKGIYFLYFFGSVLFYFNSFLLLGHPYWWIVFVAPSAAAFVTPILRNHFELRTSRFAIASFRCFKTPSIKNRGDRTHNLLILARRAAS